MRLPFLLRPTVRRPSGFRTWEEFRFRKCLRDLLRTAPKEFRNLLVLDHRLSRPGTLAALKVKTCNYHAAGFFPAAAPFSQTSGLSHGGGIPISQMLARPFAHRAKGISFLVARLVFLLPIWHWAHPAGTCSYSRLYNAHGVEYTSILLCPRLPVGHRLCSKR